MHTRNDHILCKRKPSQPPPRMQPDLGFVSSPNWRPIKPDLGVCASTKSRDSVDPSSGMALGSNSIMQAKHAIGCVDINARIAISLRLVLASFPRSAIRTSGHRLICPEYFRC